MTTYQFFTLVVLVGAVFTSAVLCFLVSRGVLIPVSLDIPNARSLHQKPIPRQGGIAIFAGVAVGLLVAQFADILEHGVLPVFILALPVLLVSAADDYFSVSVRVRLLVHLVSAILLVFLVARNNLEIWIVPGLLLTNNMITIPTLAVFIVWMTNLFNFMDGMDGFAGGMSLVGFGTLSLLGILNDSNGFALFNGVIAISASGFLAFNFPPARIFMGDVGSATLGFLAAGSIIYADTSHVVPFWLGALVFAPFIFDASFTVLKRLIEKKRIWEAHREHLYQRMVLSGLTHKHVVLIEYGLMGVYSAMVLISVRYDLERFGWVLLAASGFVFLLFYLTVLRRERIVRMQRRQST